METGNDHEGFNDEHVLAKLYRMLTNSIRILKMKRKNPESMNKQEGLEPAFKRLRHMIMASSGLVLTRQNLAQMRYILPEAIKSEVVLVYDVQTSCMKQEVRVDIDPEWIESDGLESKFVQSWEIFWQRLKDVYSRTPAEGTEIPEGELPGSMSCYDDDAPDISIPDLAVAPIPAPDISIQDLAATPIPAPDILIPNPAAAPPALALPFTVIKQEPALPSSGRSSHWIGMDRARVEKLLTKPEQSESLSPESDISQTEAAIPQTEASIPEAEPAIPEAQVMSRKHTNEEALD